MWPYYPYSPLEVYSAWSRGGRLALDWPQFRGNRVILTHFSRIAIFKAFQLLHLRPGDEILMPAYNCGSEIDPLVKCGAEIVFYRVDHNTRIDIDDIKQRFTSKTRAVYVIHYFGWPHHLSELARWCKDQNLFLIEDCALSLLSHGPDGPLGRMGDVAIHCFWKTLPVPDGGALCFTDRNFSIREKMHSPPFGAIFDTTKSFAKNWLRNMGRTYSGRLYNWMKKYYRKCKGKKQGHLQTENKSVFPGLPQSYYFDKKIKDWGISRISKGIISSCDPERIVQLRRRNYKKLFKSIQGLKGVKALFKDLPEGVCPLVFPVLVSDPVFWARSLKELNVYHYRWWMCYHPDFSWDGFPEAVSLKNHVLAFHLHQDMDEDELRHIAEGIKTVSMLK